MDSKKNICPNYRVLLFSVNMKKQFKSHYHCVYNLQYHLVLVSKYRRKCFTSEILQRLEVLSTELCTKWDIILSEFGGEEDHIHLLLEAHPNVIMSRFINNLKTVTSRIIRKEYKIHLSQYYWKPVLWTRAYCLLTAGGAPIKTIRQYIENQGKR